MFCIDAYTYYCKKNETKKMGCTVQKFFEIIFITGETLQLMFDACKILLPF